MFFSYSFIDGKLKIFYDTDKINDYIVKYMNKELSSYSNTERNNILNYYFKN